MLQTKIYFLVLRGTSLTTCFKQGQEIKTLKKKNSVKVMGPSNNLTYQTVVTLHM